MSHRDDVFIRTFVLVLGVLVAMAVIFFILAQIVTGPSDDGKTDAQVENVIEDRIGPVGTVAIGERVDEAVDEPTASAPVARSGKEIVTESCAACHASGTLNAPKIGAKVDWEARLAKGLDALIGSAINGLNAMPARGGNASLSDEEINKAVVFMLEESGLDAAATSTPTATPEATSAAVDQPAPPQAADADTGDADLLANGKEIYTKACFACHGTGAAGAPKVGNKSEWSERITQGIETLVGHAVKGFQGSKGYMPPKGGHPYLSDEEIHASVTYMVTESQ